MEFRIYLNRTCFSNLKMTNIEYIDKEIDMKLIKDLYLPYEHKIVSKYSSLGTPMSDQMLKRGESISNTNIEI